MTPQQIIRRASLAGIHLNISNGRLIATSHTGPPQARLSAAMKAHKPAIVHVLTVWPHIASLREDTLARCRPLTPDDLTAVERLEAEILAADLIEAGGLGQFVIDLMHTWNDLNERDRLMAAWCWECGVAQLNLVAAA